MLPWTLMSPRILPERRIGCDEKGNADLGFNAVAKQVDGFDMQIRCVQITRDAELGLLCLDIAECALNRLFHSPRDTARHL